MKKTLCIIILLLAATTTLAADATFSWLPNSEPDLKGYKIHCGASTRAYTISADVGKPATQAGRVIGGVSGLAESTTYYCAASAYDNAGNQSGYSNEVTVAIGDLPPSPPGGLKYEATFTGTVILTPIK